MWLYMCAACTHAPASTPVLFCRTPPSRNITHPPPPMGAALTTGKKVKWGAFSLKIKKPLGEGGFGFVYLVKDKPTGKRYALKRVLCQVRGGGLWEGWGGLL